MSTSSGSVFTRVRAPDLPKAEAAIRDLLVAVGLDPDDPALADTPAKAAEAIAGILTAGYDATPEEAIGRGFPVPETLVDPVVAVDIPARFVCPHHLMPARARVHVAFVPAGRVPGLARIARLVDALGHRLVLQEDLGRWIVDALVEHLSVRAAVAVVEASHSCVAVEDFARRDTVFRTRAARGDEAMVASLTSEIDASLRRSWATSASEPPMKAPEPSSPSS